MKSAELLRRTFNHLKHVKHDDIITSTLTLEGVAEAICQR